VDLVVIPELRSVAASLVDQVGLVIEKGDVFEYLPVQYALRNGSRGRAGLRCGGLRPGVAGRHEKTYDNDEKGQKRPAAPELAIEVSTTICGF
jgi:hypothetical protein